MFRIGPIQIDHPVSKENGELTEKEMVPILDNGGYATGDYAAEIEICPDKNYLYASTRKSPMSDENGAMVVFAIGKFYYIVGCLEVTCELPTYALSPETLNNELMHWANRPLVPKLSY